MHAAPVAGRVPFAPVKTPPRRQKRSLTHSGGPIEPWGDAGPAAKLAECLDVDPELKLPFTHGFHAYPARMHPHTAERALARFGKPGDRVLDPFTGSGTTALEAVRAGMAFSGSDISAVALEIAWARTRVMPVHECRLIEREGHGVAEEAGRTVEGGVREPRWAAEVAEWFSPHTLREIGRLSDLVDRVQKPWLRRILRVVLSAILVRLSKQASDSVTVMDANWRPWPPAAAYRMFAEKCSEVTRSYLFLSGDVHKRGVKTVEPEFWLADARELDAGKAAFDLALTSPPYPGTYDYSFHHRLRYPLFGEDSRFVHGREIGSRREFKSKKDALHRYRDDMRECLARTLDALRPGAPALVLIGDGRFGEATVRSDTLVAEIASAARARVVAGASQERTEWSFGGRVKKKKEHLLLVVR
jgi:hypothetical protein